MRKVSIIKTMALAIMFQKGYVLQRKMVHCSKKTYNCEDNEPNSAIPAHGDSAGGSPIDSPASSFAMTPGIWNLLSETRDIVTLRFPLTDGHMAFMEAEAMDEEILANTQE